MAGSRNIVIVGASLAGLRTAEAVLTALPDARVTLIGEERHAPYNRPPLSKEVAELLAGADTAQQDDAFEKLLLRSRLAAGAVEMRLGVAAASVDAAACRLTLSDGATLSYDWLIAATGLRPRRLPMKQAMPRRHVLRGFDDAVRLGQALRPGARLVVAGGGFIGCEIAATAVKLGLEVTLIEPAPQVMYGALGPRVSQAMAAFHRRHEVQIITGHALAALRDEATALEVILDDGRALQCDLLIEAIGSHPNTEWLQGAGLDLSDGVLCDDSMRAVGADRILAVGDVARFPNGLFGPAARRIEHWCVPGQTARRAAQTIAALEQGQDPAPGFAPMPSFWSDQHGLRLQSFGAPGLADAVEVLKGDLSEIGTTPCLVEYRRGGILVAVLGLGAPPAMLAPHQARLTRALAPAPEPTP